MDLRRLFVENWAIKLASLVLAVTLWFYVTSKGKTEVSLSVPLELRNIPAGMAVVGEVPARIEVRLQGQERLLRDSASSKNVAGVADLSRGREGENIIRLSPEDFRKPSDVFITHLSPFEITVKLDQLVRRTLRLRPVFSGAPAPGYRLGAVAVSPPRITLEGPRSIIETFTTLQTRPIDLTGMKENAAIDPRIDYQGKPVKILEQNISISIGIQKERP